MLVTKKDGLLQLCLDYRKLNSCMRMDAYPIPRVDKIHLNLGLVPKILSGLNVREWQSQGNFCDIIWTVSTITRQFLWHHVDCITFVLCLLDWQELQQPSRERWIIYYKDWMTKQLLTLIIWWSIARHEKIISKISPHLRTSYKTAKLTWNLRKCTFAATSHVNLVILSAMVKWNQTQQNSVQLTK